MSPLDRSEKFQFRLAPDERHMLDTVADQEGLSPSDMLRQLIRRAFAESRLQRPHTGEPSPRAALVRPPLPKLKRSPKAPKKK